MVVALSSPSLRCIPSIAVSGGYRLQQGNTITRLCSNRMAVARAGGDRGPGLRSVIASTGALGTRQDRRAADHLNECRGPGIQARFPVPPR